MANPVNSDVSVGWKNEMVEASDMEFLKWFYLNSNTQDRKALEEQFIREQKKALPKNLR